MVKHTLLQASLMDSSGDLGPPPPPLPPHPHNHHRHQLCPRHHHQHLHIVPNCPLHSFLLKPPSHHSPSCPLFSPFPNHLNPQPLSSSQFPGIPNLPVREPEITLSDAMMMQEENLEEEPDEEEDPIFVLTDEWRDFFAKSEAKRRQAKKQAKKHKN
ncbi:PREDICTED: forkhead box protein L2-like [Ipomoea nil]|uniref:forkhead box protein L2-like n=1 Tax=Ipomoea nil TaxID=35883 RepID=UPI000900FDB1|nr:PREDICTED: forkhead box protein L2-like [Ipomoea nil]XP_019180156.1 PREDICTED: forkhead box protein L2-like [Ipomoea nil]